MGGGVLVIAGGLVQMRLGQFGGGDLVAGLGGGESAQQLARRGIWKLLRASDLAPLARSMRALRPGSM